MFYRPVNTIKVIKSHLQKKWEWERKDRLDEVEEKNWNCQVASIMGPGPTKPMMKDAPA